MRKIECIGLIFITAVIFVTLAPSYSNAAAEGPIKIGLLLDYTGMGGGDIPWHGDGVKLKLDEVGWQTAGRKIELITGDTGGDPVKGTEKAQKLVQADKVDVVIGPVWAHVAFAVAPVLAESKTPQILPNGHSIGVLKSGAGNVFMLRGSHLGENYYSGVYAYEDLGYRTAVVLHDDFVGGEELSGGFVKAFQERGGTIVQIQKPPLGTFDFAPYLGAMKKADVVAIWLIPPELPAFYKQYREFGLKMPIIHTFMQAWHEIWKEAGDACLNTIGQIEYSASIDTDVNRRFQKAFRDKYGKPASLFHEAGYASASIFLEAVKATKGDTRPDQINKALKKVSAETPEGRLSFSPDGIGIGDALIVRIVKKDGRYETEILKTYKQVVRKAPSE